MLTRREISLQDLNLEGLRELQENPELAETLVAVCQELYKIVSNLVDEKQPIKALTVVTAVTRMLRSVLTKKRPEILAIVQELKTKIEPDLRPSLRIKPRYATYD